MRWEDERYVRVYTRDTADWLALSFDAQALFCLLLRKVDRAGVLSLGKQGRKAAAICLGQVALWSRLEPALAELEADGCVVVDGDRLIVPNFIEAQEAKQSDKARQAKSRETARAVTKRDAGVTNRDEMSHAVTGCHTESHAVTPSRAVPCLAVPSRADEKLLSADADESPPVERRSEASPMRLAVPTVEQVAEVLADTAPLLTVVPPEPKPDPRAAQAREVFEHWRRVMGKTGRTEFDGKRRRAVEARLAGGYSVADLCAAVDGCAVTPWNNGTETGKRFDDLELICRTAAQVDRFIANAADPPRLKTGTRDTSTDAAFQPREDW